MSLLICGVDVETTGLDTNKDEIIELAAVIWDVDRRCPVMMQSDLVKIEKPIAAEIHRYRKVVQLYHGA
jgi:oligoribonuclease (3'-5' exoribonuclease)